MIDPKEALLARIQNDFAYHKADGVSVDTMKQIRNSCYLLAQQLAESVPSGRELSSALTNLEQVMFHANAGITRPMPIAD